jgi:DNA-binding response OmpR family regulator
MARILAVDDEPTITRLVQAALAKDEHDVITAGNGDEALLKARTEVPDLILLDVMMPGMDGHEVLMRLREDPATEDIPVAFLTAVGDMGSQLAGLEEGAIDYITKPFAPTDLRGAVRELLDPALQNAHDKLIEEQKARLRTYKEVMRRKTEES